MSHDFRRAAKVALADAQLRRAVRKTTDTLIARRKAAVAACPEFETLRDRGRAVKDEVSSHLEDYVRRFADAVEGCGGTVHFARDGAEAGRIASKIAADRGITEAVKAKSMTAEEVGLNEALAGAGVTVTETDLGEFIIQLAGESPSHILAPAIHRSREDVAKLFSEVLGVAPDLGVEALVKAARAYLRERFLRAGMGITGANFAVAESGTLVIVTNEGNGRMSTTLPPVHLAVVGMEKIVPTLADVEVLLELLTRSASGQTISSYVSMTTGPRRVGETEGPEELHVIVVDNGRARVAAGPYREMLHCLHCGSCLNHCPVYCAVGGHAYESAYSGPMGSVTSTLLWGKERYPDLANACTLCGRCAEICPMRIALPDHHRRLRAPAASSGPVAGLSAWVASRAPLYRAGVAAARALFRSGFAPLVPEPDHGAVKSWRVCRELPVPSAGPSFRDWWKNHKPQVASAPGAAAEEVAERDGDVSAVPAGDPLERYLLRAAAAGVETAEVAGGALAARLAALVAETGATSVAVPRGGWPEGVRETVVAALADAGAAIVTDDGGWDRAALAGARLGVTWCGSYLAHTGSMTFDAGEAMGTLASLLPETHLALSRPEGVVDRLAGRLARAKEEGMASRLTLVTGPSRTGDIEGTMTAGVHGPGRVLHWILR